MVGEEDERKEKKKKKSKKKLVDKTHPSVRHSLEGKLNPAQYSWFYHPHPKLEEEKTKYKLITFDFLHSYITTATTTPSTTATAAIATTLTSPKAKTNRFPLSYIKKNQTEEWQATTMHHSSPSALSRGESPRGRNAY